MNYSNFFEIQNFVEVAAILGAIAAIIAILPQLKKSFQRITKAGRLTEEESSYLTALIKDLEAKNLNNQWDDKFYYIPADTELPEEASIHYIRQKYYVAKCINPHLDAQDWSNLSNLEKIDSSRGTTYESLPAAVKASQESTLVVISPPGGGKTVSLRNLAIQVSEDRLLGQTPYLPIFINLGHYTQKDEEEQVISFDSFLEDFFSKNSYYHYLSEGKWKELLLSNQPPFFFLDAIDELPRSREEYEKRTLFIKKFIEQWPNARFLLSCRELDYEKSLSFRQILIKPFDDKHIRQYIQKYFSERKEYKSLLNRIKNNILIYELCSNPFYLHLICLFAEAHQGLPPQSKSELFNFIIDKFVERENEKTQSFFLTREDLILVISELAYYLAIQKMTTTVNLEEFQQHIASHPNQDHFLTVIDYAIKGGLLEYNENSGGIRFIHNRFQEFFSSFSIIQKYKEEGFSYPENFFTNIWWRETVLFIAGLEENPDFIIQKILHERDAFEAEDPTINKLIKLDEAILAFNCIYSSLKFSNDRLYNKSKEILIDSYQKGNSLERVKILDTLKFDKTKENINFIQSALQDKSNWVSERAFFILTEGKLKMHLTVRQILKEFWRFFIEGRIINAMPAIVKSAQHSNVMKIMLPVYFVFVLANILCIGAVAYTFYTFLSHVIFHLDYAFTSECLGCLGSISFGSMILFYFLFESDQPILKKLIFLSPLSLLILNFVFSPGGVLYHYTRSFTGLLFYYIYILYFQRPSEDRVSLGSVTIGFLGANLFILVMNRNNFLFTEFKAIGAQILPSPWMNNLSDVQNQLFHQIKEVSPQTYSLLYQTSNESGDGYPIIISLLFVIICTLILMKILFDQIIGLRNLARAINEIDPILSRYEFPSHLMKEIIETIDYLNFLWSQKIYIGEFVKKLSDIMQKEEKVVFLNKFAEEVEEVDLKDYFYQYLEEEERSYRRTL